MLTNRILFLTKTVISLALIQLLSSCGSQKEVDKIGDAQQCLNESTQSTAMNCVSKVDGLTSAGAYNIRCAAAFVREGFANPTKYTSAFESLKGNTDTSAFLGLITFSSAGSIATDTENANTAFNDCYNASAKGKTLIAAFGYLSTSLLNYFASFSNSASCNAPSASGYNLTSCITAASTANLAEVVKIVSLTEPETSAAGQVQTSIGTVIISTYTISCTGKGANQDLCNKLLTSINSGGGTTNPRGVAATYVKSFLPTIPTGI